MHSVHIRLHQLHQPVLHDGTFQSCFYFPFMDHKNCWKAGHFESSCPVWILIGVQLGYSHLFAEFCCDLVHFGSHKFAWSAPSCKPVHNNRNEQQQTLLRENGCRGHRQHHVTSSSGMVIISDFKKTIVLTRPAEWGYLYLHRSFPGRAARLKFPMTFRDAAHPTLKIQTLPQRLSKRPERNPPFPKK
jgi:hypothetical protein